MRSPFLFLSRASWEAARVNPALTPHHRPDNGAGEKTQSTTSVHSCRGSDMRVHYQDTHNIVAITPCLSVNRCASQPSADRPERQPDCTADHRATQPTLASADLNFRQLVDSNGVR